MAVNMSISQMLRNPTGKHSAYFASRARVKAQLDAIFIQNLRKFRREFYAVPYINEETHDIMYYVSVPSESFYMNKIRYDCIVHIKYNKSLALDNREAKFFTNSPSFIFTYAYVFNKEDLLPEFIKSSMPTECLTQPPTIRNPVESKGYDKILYQALKYLIAGGCLSAGYIDKYKQRWTSITEAQVIRRCADTATLVSIYQHAKRMDSLKHKKNKKPVTPQQQSEIKKESAQYDRFKKSTRPNYVGFIFKKAPRSKITAKDVSKGHKVHYIQRKKMKY